MAFGEITVNKMVERTALDITKAKEDLRLAYISLGNIIKRVDNEELEVIQSYIADTFNTLDDWSKYYSLFNTILVEKTENDTKEIARLKGIIESLEDEVSRLKDENNNRVDKVVKDLNKVLNTIEENAKLIAGSKGNRAKQANAVGVNSNRYIQGLDTEKLISIYKDNNYTLTKEVKELYHRKYGITYNGLRERLIKAGVWKGRA